MQQHILIVDDEPMITHAFRRYFEAHGYRVTTKSDGQEALEAAETDPIDGVVTDFHMPKMNGVELLRRLRERSPSLPAVIVSSCLAEFRNPGGRTVVLSKPAQMESIVKALQGLLAPLDAPSP